MGQLPGDSMPAPRWVSGVLWSKALTRDKLHLGCWQCSLHSPLSGFSNLAARGHKQRKPVELNSAAEILGIVLQSLQERNHTFLM